ncbi:MAG: FprA family A-type flavoprotein [Clostridia bacterium]|nr:FprA family A-type flavoprotein [Clostridia bacterium]
MALNIAKDILYAGVEDRDIDLFEGQYPVPDGITYNSYIICDEQTAVMDGVDGRFAQKWLDGITELLGEKTPAYMVVHHMEPDHSASLGLFMEKYPEAKIVTSAQGVKMAQNLFKKDISARAVIVKEGDTLCLGIHTLRFFGAPMVHWPEVLVSYEERNKILFSADAFGKFGTFEDHEDWACEAARYYFGIVGKFGAQVQALLKKVSALPVDIICPLHGPVLKEEIADCVALYNTWSSYVPERNGVVIAYSSVYGATKALAEELAGMLEGKGLDKIEVFDLARDDTTEALEGAFRSSKLVLASPTINGDVFPDMRTYIEALAAHNYQNRFVALIESGMWAPASAKRMAELLGTCKDITFAQTQVKMLGRPDDAVRAQLEKLAEELLSRK